MKVLQLFKKHERLIREKKKTEYKLSLEESKIIDMLLNKFAKKIDKKLLHLKPRLKIIYIYHWFALIRESKNELEKGNVDYKDLKILFKEITDENLPKYTTISNYKILKYLEYLFYQTYYELIRKKKWKA